MLKVKLGGNGIRTLQAESDADVLLVDTAMEISETTDVGIVGEDDRKSKVVFAKLYLKSPKVQKAAAVFSDPSSTTAQVQRWYGAPD